MRLAFAMLLIASAAWAHPQDGPDVDARVQIKDEAVVMSLAFNLAFLDAYGLAPRESGDELHPIEQEGVKFGLIDFLTERNTVIVDGVEVIPVLREWDVPAPDRSLLPLFPNFGMSAIARVHVVIEYPILSEPSNVSIRWGAFPRDGVLSTEDDERPIIINTQMWAKGISWVQELTADEPSYTWLATDESAGGQMLDVPSIPVQKIAHLRIPALSLGLLGAGLVMGAGLGVFGKSKMRWIVAVSILPVFVVGAAVTRDLTVEGPVINKTRSPIGEDAAKAVFTPLHTNIYRSFDYTEEEDVYDALAQSVTGELLDELYGEIYAGLEMQLEDGAAVSRVQSVDHLDTSLVSSTALENEPLRFIIESTWRVTGAVFHWGHSHTRTNEYKARYTVIGAPDGWRISDTEMLEQSRIDAVPGDPNDIFRPGMDL